NCLTILTVWPHLNRGLSKYRMKGRALPYTRQSTATSPNPARSLGSLWAFPISTLRAEATRNSPFPCATPTTVGPSLAGFWHFSYASVVRFSAERRSTSANRSPNRQRCQHFL